jgi:LmbE family N-acetylglucosaminyl deacetylase
MKTMHENRLFESKRYLFLFAHPDDDVYCCVLMRRLIEEKKRVQALYLTSGDAGGRKSEREAEVFCTLKQMGMEKENVFFLQIPELDLPNTLNSAVSFVLHLAKACGTDCIVGHDYEGGHEGHDLASFCASEAGRIGGIEFRFVFPVYHGPPEKRIGARFKAGRETHVTLPFEKRDRELKQRVLFCYGSQREHFERLGRSGCDYFDLLLSRELYYTLSEPIDYSVRPTSVVGYEFHRNGFTFEAFQKALDEYRKTGPYP